MGGSLKDFSKQRLAFYKIPFVHDNFFRFGTEERYSVTTGYMMVVFSCAFLFCFAKPTFFRDA